jgi:hypothetical protein
VRHALQHECLGLSVEDVGFGMLCSMSATSIMEVMSATSVMEVACKTKSRS